MSGDKWVAGVASIAEAIGCNHWQVQTLRELGALEAEQESGVRRAVRARESAVRDARAYFEKRIAEHLSGKEHGQIVGAPQIAAYLGTSDHLAKGMITRGEIPTWQTETSPYVAVASTRDLDRIKASGGVPKRSPQCASNSITIPGPMPDESDVFGETRRLLIAMRAPLWKRIAERKKGAAPRGEVREARAYGISIVGAA